MKRPSLLILSVLFSVFCLGISLFIKNAEAVGQAPVPHDASHPRNKTPLLKEELKMAHTVKQGETFMIQILHPRKGFDEGTAWLTGVKAPLFKQTNGSLQGVMPVKVNQKPGGYTFKIQNRDGKTLYESKVEVVNAHYSKQNIRVSSSMKGTQPESGELETIGKLKKETGGTRYWTVPFVAPTTDCMNSRFGNLRLHNGKFTGNYHKGIDLRSPQGRPIRATTGGTVKISRFYRLHGGTVGLDHGQGISSIYIHMSKLDVKPGEKVEKGQVIGRVGSTGFATGPHLHWGLYVNGLPVNPAQWVHPKRC